MKLSQLNTYFIMIHIKHLVKIH
ncbi:MAG TPA: hypothetical protein ENK59_04205 [Thioploca sp.]|nr:hypothetical protein [Thioploca sp.]